MTLRHEAETPLPARLVSSAREHPRRDIACRYGGEELSRCDLPDSAVEDAVSRADEIREIALSDVRSRDSPPAR